jgi:hypothetical protein
MLQFFMVKMHFSVINSEQMCFMGKRLGVLCDGVGFNNDVY